MIKNLNEPSFNHANLQTFKRPLQLQQLVQSKKLKTCSIGSLSLLLVACNDTTKTTPCTNYSSNNGTICLDTDLENEPETTTNNIEIPSEQIPVSGTLTSDTFVTSSNFLTSKTVIDGGNGTDTLNLNLKHSVKNSPTIQNVENLQISTFGDYSLNLSNVSDLEYVLSEDSLGKLTINGLSNPATIFGFSGNGVNSTTLTSNDLGGIADKLKLMLIEASDVTFNAPLGYEEIELELDGPSS